MLLDLYPSNQAKVLLNILAACVKAVAAIFLVLVMFPNVPVFLDKITGEINAPNLYLLQIILGALVLVLSLKHYRRFLSLAYLHWFFALLLVYCWTLLRLQYFLTDATEYDIGHAIDRIERALLIPVFIVLMVVSSSKHIIGLFILSVVLIPVPIILDFFYPEYFASSVAARAAGTFLNANQAGEAVLLWLFIVNPRLPRLLIIPFYLLAGFAVILTFSRAGMLAWAFMGLFLIYTNRISRWMILVPAVVAIFYSTILINAEDWLIERVDTEAEVSHLVERLDVFGKLGIGMGEAIDDSSREAREEIAGLTLEHIWKQPILGYGYDVERNLDINSHVMPLQLWYTFGLPGLVLYFWLALLLFRAGKQYGYGYFSPFLLLFVWFSFFDHAHTTDNYWLITYAFVFRRLKSGPSKVKVKSKARSAVNPVFEKYDNAYSTSDSSGKTSLDLYKTIRKKAKSRSRAKSRSKAKANTDAVIKTQDQPQRKRRRKRHRAHQANSSLTKGHDAG